MGSHEIKEMRNTILERSKSSHRTKIKKHNSCAAGVECNLLGRQPKDRGVYRTFLYNKKGKKKNNN